MGDKVKVQDIADRAGLSRNTVSKIFNGKYRGSEDIKNKVLKLAVEMQYKEYGQVEQIKKKENIQQEETLKQRKSILVFSKGDVIASNFFAHIVNEIQKRIEGAGYTLLLVNVTQNDIEHGIIPAAVDANLVDGMICMEVFDKNYIKKLLERKIPAVFVEFYYNIWEIPGKYDVVMMDNQYNLNKMTEALIKHGCKRIGFAGDYKHCLGFYERFKAYCNALRFHQMEFNSKYSFTMNDGEQYFDIEWLSEQMQIEKIIPDAYVCANDAIAINIIAALKKAGYKVPEDVQVISFDDIQEAALTKPALTTVRIFREDLGKSAIDCLIERMNYPDKRKQVIYVETEPVIRETTKQNIFR